MNPETVNYKSVSAYGTMQSESAPYQELQVPGEPGVWFCARHRSVRTRLRCGRCEKPICPKCTVIGPTGARCRDCGSNRASHIYKISPAQFLISFLAAVGLGIVGLAATRVLAGFWFALFFVGPAIGPVLGRVVTKITGGKRGPILATVVSCGIAIGALGSSVGSTLMFLTRMPKVPAAVSLPTQMILLSAFEDPFLWLFLVLSIVGIWWWLK